METNLEVLQPSLQQPTMSAKLSSGSGTLQDQGRTIVLLGGWHSVHGVPDPWTWKSLS